MFGISSGEAPSFHVNNQESIPDRTETRVRHVSACVNNLLERKKKKKKKTQVYISTCHCVYLVLVGSGYIFIHTKPDL